MAWPGAAQSEESPLDAAPLAAQNSTGSSPAPVPLPLPRPLPSRAAQPWPEPVGEKQRPGGLRVPGMLGGRGGYSMRHAWERRRLWSKDTGGGQAVLEGEGQRTREGETPTDTQPGSQQLS